MKTLSSWKFLFGFIILVLFVSGIDFYFRPPGSVYVWAYLLGFILYDDAKKSVRIWWLLCVLHVLAHILFPAYLLDETSRRQIPNPHFNPLFDYCVHALQCGCIFLLTKSRFARLVGMLFAGGLILGAWYVQIDPSFLGTLLWKCLSFGGVFGTICHHLLLDCNPRIVKLNLWIWCSPYVGYLLYDSTTIWLWDEQMHKMGLFYWWYLCYGLTYWAVSD